MMLMRKRLTALTFALFWVASSANAQTGVKISEMPPGGNVTGGVTIIPALEGTTSTGFVNFQEVIPLGSSTTAGLLQCGSGTNCSAGVLTGASFPTEAGSAFKYLMTNGSSVQWNNPAAFVDPRTYGASCVGAGNSGPLNGTAGQGIYVLNAGNSGTSGTYTSVPITGGSGTGGIGTFTVSGGSVTAITITTAGTGYKLRDQISAASANIGNTLGFAGQVANFGTAEGPVYDGVHDDTAAFQTAFGVAQNTGQAVLVPNGCWVSTLNIPQGVTMVGQGYAPTYGFGYNGNIAQTMPVLYEENAATFVIHFGASSNNGFFGFEVNDSANHAFQTAYCLGTDQAAGAGTPHIFIRGMSFTACLAGVGTPNDSSFFPLSYQNIYAGNVYGMFGYINDMISMGDTFGSNASAGIGGHGGGWNLVDDRFEYNGEGVDANLSTADFTSDQFDTNTNAALRFIDGTNFISISSSHFDGNGNAHTTGNNAAIIMQRNTSNPVFQSSILVSGSVFNQQGTNGPSSLQNHVLEVATTGANNDFIDFEGDNALYASSSGFAIYDNGMPPHVKFNNVSGVANYNTLDLGLTTTGCSTSATNSMPRSGAITSGVTGPCTVTVIPDGANNAPQPDGWTCGSFFDKTTTSNSSTWSQLSTTTTSAVLSGTTSTGDVVSFSCNPY